MSNANNVPQIHPARKDSAVQEKTKLVASTEEKIEEKPAEMSQARPKPISEPRPLAAKAKAAPSYRNKARVATAETKRSHGGHLPSPNIRQEHDDGQGQQHTGSDGEGTKDKEHGRKGAR